MTTLLLRLPARAREAMLLHTGLLTVNTNSKNSWNHIIKSSCRQGYWQPPETCSVSIQGSYKGTSQGRNLPVPGRPSLRDLRVVSMIQRTIIRPFSSPSLQLAGNPKRESNCFPISLPHGDPLQQPASVRKGTVNLNPSWHRGAPKYSSSSSFRNRNL